MLDLKFEISDLKLLSESVSRQLRGWSQHLQDAPIRGQRHLTIKSRQYERAQRGLKAFIQELKTITGREGQRSSE